MPRLTASVVALLLTWSRFAGAQAADSDFVERGPRFLLASTSAPVPVRVDVTRTPVLRQSISLDLSGVALSDALREISAKAGMQLAFSNTMLPAERTVTFRADHITVAAALTELLIDARVDVLFSRDGRAVLVRRAEDFQGGTVSGKVTDAKTGKAIPNVSVFLEGTRWRATTRDDGAYRLVDVTAGTYTLTASRIGYTKKSPSVAVVAGQEVTVDLALQAAASELEQVIVTGTVVPTERKAIPTPISVVTAEDIQQQNLQRVDQVFRGLVPGGIAWDEGPNDYHTEISVRGVSSLYASPSIKTFIDGVEVTDPQSLGLIDPNSIDRIEVTRGPQASTLYGAGALNGVMQIFTKKGEVGFIRPEVTGKVSGGGVGGFDGQGTALQTDNALSVLGGGGKASYNLGGSYRHVGEWVPSYGSTDWRVFAGGETSQGPLTLSSSLRHAEDVHTDPWDTRFQTYTAFSRPSYLKERLRQETVGLTASLRATGSWQHTLTLGYDQEYFHTEQTQPRFRTAADSFLTTNTFHEAKISLLYHTDLSLRLGTAVTAIVTTGFNDDWYDFASTFTSRATRTTGSLDGTSFPYLEQWTNTGYFGQVQVSFADRLFLTGGLRAERNPNFGADLGTVWSPRAGAAYVLGLGPATVKLRASYGEGIRAPAPGQRDAVRAPSYEILANPALAPEKQRGVDGGVEIYLARASLGATYYSQRVLNLIEQVTVPMPPGDTLPTYQYQNLSRAKNEGWEFDGRLRLGPVQFAGTYSITNSTVQQLPPGYPAGGYQVGDQVLAIPHTSAGATITYSPRAQTILTVSVTHIGHWTNDDVVAIYAFAYGGQPYRGSERAYRMVYPTVTKFAVGVSQVLRTGLTAFVRAENVGNNLRYENANTVVPTPRSVMVGANVRY